MSNSKKQCPCGSLIDYKSCCEVFHRNLAVPNTAEQLMRSRFSAFAKSEFEYLMDSTPTADRVATLKQLVESNRSCVWLSLEIVDVEAGLENDLGGWVEFLASYFENGKISTMRERSQFEKRGDRWMYIDGMVMPAAEPVVQSMNGSCYCGSAKKFKRCHGK